MPEDLQPEFEQYSQIFSDEKSGGLLTNDTSIKVIYRKDGDRFHIQWNSSGDLEPIERELNGQWKRAEGDIQQRFPVRIYSQKQIFQIAKTPLALLKIIDEAPEVGYQAWSEKCNVQESRFLALRTRIREIVAGLGEEPRLRGELDDVERKLAIFEQSGHTEILKTFQERSRQYREVEEWEENWTGTGEQLHKVAAEIVPDPLEGSSFDSDSASDEDLQIRATKTHDRLEQIRKSVELLASQSDEVAVEWKKARMTRPGNRPLTLPGEPTRN